MNNWKYFLILSVALLTLYLGSLPVPAEEPKTPAEKVLLVRELPEFRLTKGEVLYSRYCAFCHGDSGAGDGLNAYSIPVRPRDFNDSAVMAERTDKELANVILSGGVSRGLSAYMPAFNRTLSPRQADFLVSFIRSISDERPE